MARFPMAVVLFVGGSLALAGILPASMDCTRSAQTVEVSEVGTEAFYCPEYFANRTCCSPEDTASVWEKVEDILQFIQRVLGDQSKELEGVTQAFEGGPCADYHSSLFSSRAANYRRAREAAEKGAEVLQGAAMHFLCAACFVCAVPLKTRQLDDFIQRALRSVQETVRGIWQDQVVSDRAPDPGCELAYVAAVSAGVPFPSWGAFQPDMAAGGLGLNGTFADWLDRVLSLVLELPGALLFQHSLIELSFFYAERTDSDAFAVLHTPPDSTPGKEAEATEVRAQAASAPNLCPRGQRRLLVLVPQDANASRLADDWDALEENASAWSVTWVVTAPGHVRALGSRAEAVGSGAREERRLLWRRFEVRDSDAFAGAVCRGEATWVARLGAAGADLRGAAPALQRLAVDPRPDDVVPSSWPKGFHPAAPLPSAGPWPSDALVDYLEAHARFRATPTPSSRVLIYTCTSITFCGGHGDRLNGMLSAAVVALLSGRLFFIDSQRPVPLAMVLSPGPLLDWRLFGTLAALPASFNFNDNLAGFEADPRRVLDSQATVVRFVSNQRLTPAALRAAPQQAAAFGLRPRPRLHADLFRLLFRPAPALRSRLAKRGLPAGPLIGIHFRAGDQMPQHWKDPPRHALDELDEFLDCAERVEASMRWEDGAHLVLFADTDRVLELPRVQALRESGKLVWPARTDTLVHLDRSPATLSVRGLLGVWADWWTLAFDVDALVLCQSGFGATALEIGPERPAFLGQGCIPAEGSTG